MQRGTQAQGLDLIGMERVSDLTRLLQRRGGRIRYLLKLFQHRVVIFLLADSKQCAITNDDKTLTKRIVKLHRETAALAFLRLEQLPGVELTCIGDASE